MDFEKFLKYPGINFKKHCRKIILLNEYKSVCDIGGGRYPVFTTDEIRDLGIEYTILDISQSELKLAPDGYNKKICADICSVDIVCEFDFMFSKVVAEHVRDGVMMHRNIFKMLKLRCLN